MKILMLITLVLFQNSLNRDRLQLDSKPLVVHLSLNKKEYKLGEEILINLFITNEGKMKEKLLFEGRNSFPWATQATIKNLKTRKSAVKYQKSQISSQIYTENQLTKYYYTLKAGQSTIKKCKLSEIVVFDHEGYTLPKGSYEIEVNYYNKTSNKIRFIVI